MITLVVYFYQSLGKIDARPKLDTQKLKTDFSHFIEAFYYVKSSYQSANRLVGLIRKKSKISGV